jgi:hypothetical protein
MPGYAHLVPPGQTLGFLLLTCISSGEFILTSKFIPGEAVKIVTPRSAFSLSLRGRDHQSRSAEIFPAGFR